MQTSVSGGPGGLARRFTVRCAAAMLALLMGAAMAPAAAQVGSSTVWSGRVTVDDITNLLRLGFGYHKNWGGALDDTTFTYDGVDYTITRTVDSRARSSVTPDRPVFQNVSERDQCIRQREIQAGGGRARHPFSDHTHYGEDGRKELRKPQVD